MQRKRTSDNQVAYILDVMANGAEFSESPQKKNKPIKLLKLADIARKLRSPFHQAVLLNELDVVITHLADRSWEVNQTDIHGLTPLHLAVMCRHYEMIQVLLTRNASLYLQAEDGVSAYEFAQSGLSGSYGKEYAEIVELMDKTKNAVKNPYSGVLYRSPEPSEYDPKDIYYINSVSGKRIVGPGFFMMKFGSYFPVQPTPAAMVSAVQAKPEKFKNLTVSLLPEEEKSTRNIFK
jgi:hypothetical protein